MKNIAQIGKSIAVLGLFGTMMTACNLDINDNPNKAVTSDAEFLLPPAILKLTNYETITLNELGSFFGGYWGKANDVTIGGGGGTNSYLDMIINYSISDEFATQVWEQAYTNIYNIKLIEDAEENRNPAYAGMAKIMRGWYFYRLVDHYNNVPFTEASNPNNTQPKYDKGEFVYQQATQLITEGINLLKNAPVGSKFPKSDDILFNGNTKSWIQLGNTLKLRALIHQSEVASSSYIQEQMQLIQQEGSGFLQINALVNPGYSTNANQINGFWNAFYRTTNNNEVNAYRGYRPTRFLIEAYKKVNDPRLAQNYTAVDGDYKGVVFGQPTNDISQNYAVTSALKGPSENSNQPAGLLKSATQSSVLFSAAESYFLQAEAAQRGWLTAGSVKQYYENAIRSSFDYLGLSAAAFQSFISQEQVQLDQAPNALTRIIEQKWLALNGIDGAEAWNDYRRLGIPAAPGSLLASADGTVHALRLRYPASEVNNNKPAVSAEGNIVGTSPEFRVFWQKK